MAKTVEFGIENNPKSNGKKEGKGRRKVQMKRIEDKNKRHVTFSKRKKGLFNKAGELSVLTGAEIAGIIMSSNGKVFSFGSPTPDSVIRRYLGVSGGSTASSLLRCGNGEVGDYLEAKRRMKEEKMNYVNNTRDTNVDGGEERGGGCWWETAVGGLDLVELEEYMKALHKLKQNVDVRMNEMIRSSTVGCFSSLMDMDV